MLREVHLTCDLITPLFMSGADPRGAPELRPPGIRGALRYWLRALTGAAGEDAMKRYEGVLFGTAGDEKEGGAGAIGLRTLVLSAANTQGFSELAKKGVSEEKKKASKDTKTSGAGYLWFAARGTTKEPERQAIVPPFQFRLTLNCSRSKHPEQDLKQALAVVWLLSRLGGIGARSRRCAGALQVSELSASIMPDALKLPVQAKTPEKLRNEIQGGIAEARTIFGIAQASSLPTTFDILHKDTCRIFVLDHTFEEYSKAIESISGIFQEFRSKRQRDYDAVKSAMRSGKNLSDTVKRAAFGLPVPFYFRSLGRNSKLQASRGNEKIDRRSSPLWMRVVRLANNKYTIVFTWFKSQFLPSDAQLILTEKGKSDLRAPALPDDCLIQMFLLDPDPQKKSSLKDKGYRLLEVSL